MGEKLDRLLKKVGMTQTVMPKLVSASKEFDALGAPDTRSGRQEGFFNNLLNIDIKWAFLLIETILGNLPPFSQDCRIPRKEPFLFVIPNRKGGFFSI